MYIIKNLLKEINKNCFTHFQNELKEYLPVSQKSLTVKFLDTLHLLEVMGPVAESIKKQTEDMVVDIMNYTSETNTESFKTHNTFKSPLGIELSNDMFIASINCRRYFRNKLKDFSSFQDVMDALVMNDEHACIVGGAVRDVMIGKEPKDIDFVSALPYDRLEELFTEAGFKVDNAGKNFLVLRITKDNDSFEIANFRRDGTYVDGRRPDSVSIGNIYEDSLRRDFSCNTLFYNISSGTVLDPTGDAISDINSRTLRFNGQPRLRIREDGLRLFRGYRFISQGWIPEPSTLRALREYFTEAHDTTHPERIRAELEKICKLHN
jgi:hypothetical protein